MNATYRKVLQENGDWFETLVRINTVHVGIFTPVRVGAVGMGSSASVLQQLCAGVRLHTASFLHVLYQSKHSCFFDYVCWTCQLYASCAIVILSIGCCCLICSLSSKLSGI